MDHNQMAEEMVKNLQANGNAFLTEVAMPGVRPDALNTKDIVNYPDDVKKIK